MWRRVLLKTIILGKASSLTDWKIWPPPPPLWRIKSNIDWSFNFWWTYSLQPKSILNLVNLKLLIIYTLTTFECMWLCALRSLLLRSNEYMRTFVYTYPLSASYIPRFLRVFSLRTKHIFNTNGITTPLWIFGWI